MSTRYLSFFLAVPVACALAQTDGDVIINEIGNNGTKREAYQGGDYVELVVLRPAGVNLGEWYLTDLTGASSEGKDNEGAVKFSGGEGSVFRTVIPQGTIILICLGGRNEKYGLDTAAEDVSLDDGNGRLVLFAYSSKPHIESTQGTIVFTGRDNLALLTEWKNESAVDLVTWGGASRWSGAVPTVLTGDALDNGKIAYFAPRGGEFQDFRDNSAADMWISTMETARSSPGKPNPGVRWPGENRGSKSSIEANPVTSRRNGVTPAVAGKPGAQASNDTEGPRTFLVDPVLLAKSRDMYRVGDRRIVPAVQRVLRDAERAMTVGPFSVMDKKQVPPSGDKHDYMSLGRYWWPDPAKPDGLPYIRRDGVSNPETDSVTDHNELSQLIKGVVALTYGYYFSGDEKYAGHAALLLRTWFLDAATRMNPNLMYSQAVRGRNEGRGAGIIDAHQLPELLDGVGLLRGSSSWTAADQRGMVTWCTGYLSWLQTSDHGRHEAAARNNHGNWYDVQECSAALFVGDTASAVRTVEAARARRIAAQIEPDGSQPEELQRTKSWDYSLFNLAAMFRLASLGERIGVDLWNFQTPDGRGIRKAVDWLLPFVAGDQTWKNEQIVEQKSTGIAPLFLQAAIVWKDERYRAAAGKVKGYNARTDRSVFSLGAW